MIGVDLGGSAVRIGVVTRAGRLRHFKQIRIPEGRKKDLVLACITGGVRELIALEAKKGNKVISVGVGSPGIIKRDKGVVVTSPNFPGWSNVPLKSLIEEAVHLPVFLDNDANAAAFGEKWRGAGRKVNSLICLTMGTGIGGGIILDGNLWHGAHGMGGEIGHMTIDPDGPRCSCGNYGCLEAYSSATGMVRGATEAIKEGKRTILKKLSNGDDRQITAKMIYEAATQGDRLSIAILKKAGSSLGIAIISLINILNPDMIVLTGAVTGAWDLFMPAAYEEIEKRAYSSVMNRTKIVRGKLPGSAGVVGAAGLAWRQMDGLSLMT